MSKPANPKAKASPKKGRQTPMVYPYKPAAVESLIPYARNARTHSDAQVAQIAASIHEFGFINPVIVDGSNGIIAGHGRVLAARKLGLETVPTLEVSGLSEAQKRAYVLADNKLALNAGWDPDLLRVELADLKMSNFNLDVIGFSPDELADLLIDKTKGLTDPDDVPDAPARAVSVLGDVWLLGGHRLVCGDSTDAGTVAACLGQEKPHLMVTDPPYGVNYDPAWRQRAGVGGKGTATGVVMNDDIADWRGVWALFPGTVAYVWHGGLHSGTVADSLKSANFQIRAQIIWHKPRFALSRGHYHWQHEPAWYAVRPGQDDHWTDTPEPRFVDDDHEVLEYAVKPGGAPSWRGGRRQSTIWTIEHRKSNTGHGTQKPVECMRRPIENNSVPGNAVYEPFSGSGTTIIAGEQSGRRVLAIELNPIYVDVAIIRWQEFTGKKATLQGTGKTFEAVASERYSPAVDGEESYNVAIAEKRKGKEVNRGTGSA